MSGSQKNIGKWRRKLPVFELWCALLPTHIFVHIHEHEHTLPPHKVVHVPNGRHEYLLPKFEPDLDYPVVSFTCVIR